MASRFFTRSLLSTKQTVSSLLSRSYTCLSLSPTPPPLANSSLLRLRSLVSVAARARLLSAESTSVRGFSTRRTTSSFVNDPKTNWSNRPPKETILLDGCDFEHWLVVMEKPEGDPTRDEIIDSYIKTLAMVVGSEEEARMKLYSVSTRHYFAFGALVSEELSYKIKELPQVRWVLPDSYLDVRNKDYGGEPFINGQAVPYDPKYHEEYVRNQNNAEIRNRRKVGPRDFGKSRNFGRRENMQNQDLQMGNRGVRNPGSNMGETPPGTMGPVHPNTGGVPPNNMTGAPNMGVVSQNNMGQMPPNNMVGFPPNNMGGMTYMGARPGLGAPNMGGMPQNTGGVPYNSASNMGQVPYNAPNNAGGVPYNAPNNMGGMPYNAPNNVGGVPYNAPNNVGGMPGNAPNLHYGSGPNNGGMPFQNREMSGPWQNREYQHNNAPNASGQNHYQNQNLPGRDLPPSPNYQ